MKNTSLLLKAAVVILFASAISSFESGGSDHTLKGRVLAGESPVSESNVTLYGAGTIISETLIFDTTDSEGNFGIKFSYPSERGIIYAIACGRTPDGNASLNDAIALLTVIGEVGDKPDSVTLNELTTVTSVWTNAQFKSGNTIIGNGTGNFNAAKNIQNIVYIETDGLGAVI